jgi:hypothetical protein
VAELEVTVFMPAVYVRRARIAEGCCDESPICGANYCASDIGDSRRVSTNRRSVADVRTVDFNNRSHAASIEGSHIQPRNPS